MSTVWPLIVLDIFWIFADTKGFDRSALLWIHALELLYESHEVVEKVGIDIREEAGHVMISFEELIQVASVAIIVCRTNEYKKVSNPICSDVVSISLFLAYGQLLPLLRIDP